MMQYVLNESDIDRKKSSAALAIAHKLGKNYSKRICAHAGKKERSNMNCKNNWKLKIENKLKLLRNWKNL